MLQASATSTTYRHDAHQGFCVICGTVWPCSRGARSGDTMQVPLPVSRTMQSTLLDML